MILFCGSCRHTFDINPRFIPSFQFELECGTCHAITPYDLASAAHNYQEDEITDPVQESLDHDA